MYNYSLEVVNINKLHFDSLTSTSDYIRENAHSLESPVLVVADMQTAGRGRHGKSFHSPYGTGIYFSIGFEANDDFDLITPGAAVCLQQSISQLTGIETGIKWVNDLYLGSKKVAGILTERFVSEGKVLTVVGMGINLTTREFPPDAPVAGSLGIETDKDALIDLTVSLLLKMNDCFDRERVLKQYREKMFIIGKDIGFCRNGIDYTGTVLGVNDEGNLIVNTPGGEMTLSSGEISIKMR
ncbi:MAG: biotin--[acetyl-CoA-carboxylase] ligase [Clostridia bacterium]|nr:biotin--[acetyl-CoA-carboxylase] ligase [Clostridia bacterium]